MQKASKRQRSVIAWAACLLVALACGGQLAWASGGFPPDGTNTLTVAASNSTDEAFNADVAKANVVVDVYKVADATPNDTYVKYDYAIVAPFGSGILDYSKMDADAWMKLAAEAAKTVTADTAHFTLAADGATSLALPGDGLYLILPHGKDVALDYGENIASTFTATGEVYEYSFLPSLIVAPTKEANAEGVISTAADAGEWLRAINVVIKPAYTPIPDNPPPSDNPPGKRVQTGDTTNLLPYYVAMTISGLLLAFIAVGAIRRRKHAKGAGSGQSDA